MHGRLLNSYNFNNKILFSDILSKTNKKIDFNFTIISKKILLIDCMHSKIQINIFVWFTTIEKFYNRFFDWLDNKRNRRNIQNKKMSNIYNLNSKIKKIYNLEKEGRVYIEKIHLEIPFQILLVILI